MSVHGGWIKEIHCLNYSQAWYPTGNYRIRVGMMNPATVIGILNELMDVFESERLFRFLHIPVQSGSDRILKRMGRDYTVQDFEDIISAFRRRYPDINISTDVIVGFPGETGEDFSCSLDLIGRIKPSKVNITRYSARPFTGPFSEKDFPDSLKKDSLGFLTLMLKSNILR